MSGPIVVDISELRASDETQHAFHLVSKLIAHQEKHPHSPVTVVFQLPDVALSYTVIPVGAVWGRVGALP